MFRFGTHFIVFFCLRGSPLLTDALLLLKVANKRSCTREVNRVWDLNKLTQIQCCISSHLTVHGSVCLCAVCVCCVVPGYGTSWLHQLIYFNIKRNETHKMEKKMERFVFQTIFCF